jgi:phosphoribosylanthranilate isomerase
MSAPPRIKLCGITTVDDAQLAAEVGAWAVGMVFWPGSPRRCAVDDAAAIAASVRRRVELCGVFVNAPLDEVAAVSDAVGLTLVQLHGDEGPVFCAEVARRTGARVMKAMRVRSGEDLQALTAFRNVDFHVVDAHVEGEWGGTGQTVDWSLLAGRRSSVPLVLSGGLTPENVGEAIARVHPFAVDTASGTELLPGRKDPEKVRAFVEAVRSMPVEEAS